MGDDLAPGVLPVLLTQGGKRTVAATSSGGLGLSTGLGLMGVAESRLPAGVSSALLWERPHVEPGGSKGQDKKVRSGSQSFSNTR